MLKASFTCIIKNYCPLLNGIVLIYFALAHVSHGYAHPHCHLLEKSLGYWPRNCPKQIFNIQLVLTLMGFIFSI